MKALKTGAVLVAVLSVTSLLLWQHAQTKLLSAANALLLNQLNEIASLRQTNSLLLESLNHALENREAKQTELIRLRAQSSRLPKVEQENAQLKAQLQKLEGQLGQAQSGPLPVLEKPKPATPTTDDEDLPTTDLGIVELSEGVRVRFDLGRGDFCDLTPETRPDGKIGVQVYLARVNADGTFTEITHYGTIATLGKSCKNAAGDRMLSFTLTLK